jgi:hypothetical protein
MEMNFEELKDWHRSMKRLDLITLAIKYPNDRELGSEIRRIAYAAKDELPSAKFDDELAAKDSCANSEPQAETGTYVFSDEFDSGYVGSVKEEIARGVKNGTYPLGK